MTTFLTIRGTSEKIGFIYIENEQDKCFWISIMGDNIEDIYEFNPCSTDEQNQLTRGKKRFLNKLDKACESIVFAIDADFDPITINQNETSKKIYESKFILHTFGYSKESLVFSKENICSALSRYIYYKNHNYSNLMESFLTKISEKIYPILLRYIYSLDCNKQGLLTDEKFHNMLIPPKQRYTILHESFFDRNWIEFDKFLEAVKFTELGLIEQPCFQPCEKYMRHVQEIGLTQENAYQFINGHSFVNRILTPIIEEITNRIAHSEMTGYQTLAGTKQYDQKVSEIKNHLRKEKNFITIINMLDNWKSNALFLKAKEKASFINQSSNHS